MSTSDVNQSMATLFMPEQASPPIPAAGTADACALYCDGANLMLSVNGGAYAAVQTGAGSATLNGSYANGPAGNTISMTDALGAVTLSSARTSGSILAITQTALAAATMTGIAIDLSAAGTFANQATVDIPAITIVGARSTVAKAAGSALVQISSAYRNASALSISTKNKQASAGSIVQIGWSYENYEGLGTPGAPVATTLTGQTHVLTIDAQTNVTAGAQEVVGARILIPASSHANTRGVKVVSTQTGAASAGVEITMSPGSSASVRGASVTMGASSTGSGVIVTTTGTGGGVYVTNQSTTVQTANYSIGALRGNQVTVANGTESIAVFNATFALSNSSNSTYSCAVGEFLDAPVSGGGTLTLSGSIVAITHTPVISAGTLTDTRVGLLVTMTPANSSAVVGVSINMANSSAAGAALTIAHSGTNANQIVFTSAADGTGVHIYGPTTGTLTIKAGIRADTGAGRSIDIFARAGVNKGAGGSVNIGAGDGTGTDQNGGDISLQTGARTGTGTWGRVDFKYDAIALGGGAAATLGAIGGSGPTTAAQNQWLEVKVGGNIRWIPVWA